MEFTLADCVDSGLWFISLGRYRFNFTAFTHDLAMHVLALESNP